MSQKRHIELVFDIEFDTDMGEQQWFDYKQGVGSPGYPPSLEVTSIKLGDIELIEVVPDEDRTQLENELMAEWVEWESERGEE